MLCAGVSVGDAAPLPSAAGERGLQRAGATGQQRLVGLLPSVCVCAWGGGGGGVKGGG